MLGQIKPIFIDLYTFENLVKRLTGFPARFCVTKSESLLCDGFAYNL
jgi:hypothetical protein